MPETAENAQDQVSSATAAAPDPAPKEKTFTQAEVDAIVAKRLQRQDKQVEQQQASVEDQVRAAREAGVAEGRAAERAVTVGDLMRLSLQHNGVSDKTEQDALLRQTNLQAFFGEDGTVDHDALTTYTARFKPEAAPANTENRNPADYGFGRSEAPRSGSTGSRGASEAQRRFGSAATQVKTVTTN